MKTKIITTILFVCCCIVIACNRNKNDVIFCGGDCPKNQICINSKCNCPENANKIIADFCYPVSAKDATGFPAYPIYKIDSNAKCIFSNYMLRFPFKNKLIDTVRNDKDIEYYISEFYIDTPGVISYPPINVPVGYALREDGHYHFYFISDLKYKCPTGGATYLGAEGIFSFNFDTLNIKNYTFCGDGDTCYETRLLLK
jgi:hypothetical protein